ncbi:MAG: hypothetical protein U9Q68_05815 [Euryarchaeota archaeon]|nr:hypothetical protein [Euryarchaeota archaeon]
MEDSKTGRFKEFVASVSCTLLATILAVSMCSIAVAYTSDGETGAGGTAGIYVVGFTLDPTNATVYSGNSQRFTATATVLDTTTGETTDEVVSSDVSWQSTIGGIDSNGHFSAKEVGTGIIKVIYGTVSAEAIVTVNHGPVDRIYITANDTELVGFSELTPSVSIPFGLKGVDRYDNEFQIPDAHWTCSDPNIGIITQTGVFMFADGIVNETGGFNRSFLADNESKMTAITASVGASTFYTVDLTIYANNQTGIRNDCVTGVNIFEDPLETPGARFSPKLMAVQVMAANDWDFGMVYPGTSTGWTKVTFKNIGTCDIRITPQPPIGAFDTNIYKYAYLRDDRSEGDGMKMGSYSVDVPIAPIYNNFGRIVSFSSETQTTEVRLIPPGDLTSVTTDDGPIRYLLTSI